MLFGTSGEPLLCSEIWEINCLRFSFEAMLNYYLKMIHCRIQKLGWMLNNNSESNLNSYSLELRVNQNWWLDIFLTLNNNHIMLSTYNPTCIPPPHKEKLDHNFEKPRTIPREPHTGPTEDTSVATFCCFLVLPSKPHPPTSQGLRTDRPISLVVPSSLTGGWCGST